MRTSKTLARVRKGETVRLCSLGHFIPAYIKLASAAGFDCIWLDLEHRHFSDHEVLTLLAHSHLHDIDIMVRAPTLEKTRLYRYLEDGATGLMIPHVSTAEKAQTLAAAVKFPPLGDRGADGTGLDSDFGVAAFDDYVEHVNRETFLVAQIETPEAVENVDEIAAVEGVSAIFVGPGDLGLRLKHHDGDMTLESAFAKVAAACERHGTAWGTPVGTIEDLVKRQSQGGQLLNHGGDFGAIMNMLKSSAEDFDNNPRGASS